MKKPNRLINESSPYLLQHSYNPVDWFPWCDEAFQKAKNEDKPVFLSIGYSTCHWCHVMEKESFEDEEVAQLMNQTFVSIKVDREERPDIDHIYMMVCQMMTGHGGWPLSIIMTPDKKPFFAGTYFPKENRYGRIGFKELIKSIDNVWKTKRNEILESADEVTIHLKKIYDRDKQSTLTEDILHKAFDHLSNRFDDKFGGFGTAPKFPTPHNLIFLLRYWKKTGNPKALEMVTKTLTMMRMGGIYDHIGFGFHRYSTDREWLVPHFEKMLYDQALLIVIYTEAYLATKNEEYKRIAEEIIEYLLREMRSENGGFFSAEDADSEGIEGKFYLWKESEIIDAIGTEDSKLVFNLFNTSENGNYLEESTKQLIGNNILHLKKSIRELAEEYNSTENNLLKIIDLIRKKLFDYRKARVHPFKDDKILLDWNSLVIAALSIAGRSFNKKKYISIAEECYNFIVKNMTSQNDKLLHMFRNNRASVSAKLDDYSFFIWALIELYQSTFAPNYITEAITYLDISLKYLWDDQTGGFFFATDNDKDLIVRTKEAYDSAIPSGNSVMFYNLLRLSRITGNTKYDDYAKKLLDTFSHNINQSPSGFTFLLSSLDFYIGNSFEVILLSDEPEDKQNVFINHINSEFIPNKVVVVKTRETTPSFDYLNNYLLQSNHTQIYVCKNFNCELPTSDIDSVIQFLKDNNRPQI